jgi:hypothetical protein
MVSRLFGGDQSMCSGSNLFWIVTRALACLFEFLCFVFVIKPEPGFRYGLLSFFWFHPRADEPQSVAKHPENLGFP